MIYIKAPAQILFEISCTQDFQILLTNRHISKRGITRALFYLFFSLLGGGGGVHECSEPSIHGSKLSTKFENMRHWYSLVLIQYATALILPCRASR